MRRPNNPNRPPSRKALGMCREIDGKRGASSVPGGESSLRLARRAALTSDQLATNNFISFVESLSSLSSRERDVLLLFMEHLSDKTVASQLGTSRQTVRNQLVSIRHKLGANTREELVAALLLTWFLGR